MLALSAVLVLLGFDRKAAVVLLSLGYGGALVAGAFYTLGMTTPLAIIVILDLMRLSDPLTTALLASLAAAGVDCLFFSIVKDALEASTKKTLDGIRRKFRAVSPTFPFVGFFVFGSPLPDEIALSLMGMTEIRLPKLFAVVFAAKLLTLMLLWMGLVA